MSSPKVSVLVPIYNVEKYLEECLNSLIGQTLKDIEIICINDGSTDRSGEILSKYASEDSRIQIINKPNSGYGDSMNQGLSAAKGEYIGILESDDYAEPDFLEKLYKTASSNELDIARCNYFFHENDEDHPTDFSYIPSNKILVPLQVKRIFFQPPSIWANLFRRSFLEKNNIRFLPTPGASYQDTSFNYKAFSLAQRFMLIDDHLLHYRIHPGSSTASNNQKMFSICGEYDEIWNFVDSGEHYEENVFLLLLLQYNGYLWNCKRLDNNH